MPFTIDLPNLHCHLDGSLRYETLRSLLLPAGFREAPDLSELHFKPRMTLWEALDRFAFTVELLRTVSAVEWVASDICEDAAADGVTTLEVRFAPQLHPGSAPIEAYVDAALEGVNGRAGIILCGLYGEHPSVLEGLVEIARTRPGVVGIDLAGCPTPHQQYRMADYAPAFTRAMDLGIGRTVHAGEGGPATDIADAIRLLHAQRIGHGTTLLMEPGVLDLVIDHQVTMEVCLTSNVHTGVIPSVEEHPLMRWLHLGVRATLAPDNTLFSAVSTSDENRNAMKIPGMTLERIIQMARWGHEAAFRRG